MEANHVTKAREAAVLIIGAGITGVGAAIRLQQAGLGDVVILERAHQAGGSWRDLSYPGAACDVPSPLYTYSFTPESAWRQSYPGRTEVLRYIDELIERHGLANRIEYCQDVSGLVFDDAKGVWTATSAKGDMFRARAVIIAAGTLKTPIYPKIPGTATFEGHQFHSARWDHGYELASKRVAVVGGGVSAVQIVPELVKKVASLKVFQRTPGWVLPKPDLAASSWNKEPFRLFRFPPSVLREALFWGHEVLALGIIWDTPITALLEKVSRAHLHRQVKDPWLRRQLTPDYRIGCTRVHLSNDYFPALQKDSCKLITWPIASISPRGIRTADGIEHQVDCIVFATGLDRDMVPSFPVLGLCGRKLQDAWSRGAQACKTISVSGFPNLFFTSGPNSGSVHFSALFFAEAQINYAVRAIQTLLRRNIKTLDVRVDAQARFSESIEKRLARTQWNSGRHATRPERSGLARSLYPGLAVQYANETKFNIRDYQVGY